MLVSEGGRIVVGGWWAVEVGIVSLVLFRRYSELTVDSSSEQRPRHPRASRQVQLACLLEVAGNRGAVGGQFSPDSGVDPHGSILESPTKRQKRKTKERERVTDITFRPSFLCPPVSEG